MHTKSLHRPYDELRETLDERIVYTNNLARRFTRFYVVLRVLLIAFSATVAAQNSLGASPLHELVRWVPVLSLFVAIGTTLDTWIKPGERWRAHDHYDDEFRKLRRELDYIEPADAAAVRRIDQKYESLVSQHRSAYLF